MPDNINDEVLIDSFDDSNVCNDSAINDTNELIHSSKSGSSNRDFYIIETIVDTWSEQHQSEISLRKKYAIYLVGLLIGETALVLGIFVFIGLGWLCFTESILRLFLELTYAQLLGAFFVIVKYLFSKDSHVILNDINDAIAKIRGTER